MPSHPPPGYVLMSADTSYEVELRLLEAYRALPDDQRLARVGFLGRLVDAVAVAALRAELPQADDATIRRLLFIRQFGAEPEQLVRQVGSSPRDD